MDDGPRSLKVMSLAKSFGTVRVLNGVDLFIPAGCFAAVLGASGCGKTTLLRVIAGLENADAGTVALGAVVLEDETVRVSAEKRRIGIVPQEGALFPHLSVAQNVAFGLGSAHRSRRGAARSSRVRTLLDLVSLDGYGDRMPHQLSGGQQQRVALARCLAPEPDVVLLDEPFASLDAALRQEVRRDVQSVLHETGTTAILVTHDQDEALSMADVVAVMREGRVVQAAPPPTIYRQPFDLDLARFVGDAVIVPGVLRPGGSEVDAVFGRLQVDKTSDGSGDLATDAPVVVLLRPEQLRVQRFDSAGSTMSPHSAVIERVEYHGHDSMLTLRLDQTSPAVTVVARIATPTLSIADIGTRVEISVQGTVRVYRSQQ